jgi:hypothetical protein
MQAYKAFCCMNTVQSTEEYKRSACEDVLHESKALFEVSEYAKTTAERVRRLVRSDCKLCKRATVL